MALPFTETFCVTLQCVTQVPCVIQTERRVFGRDVHNPNIHFWHSRYATIIDTDTMPQLLTLTICHNYWHSHYATITDTHTMPQLLTLTLCHNYWYSHYAQLLTLILCHNYWHSHYATITGTHTMHNYWHSYYATITDTHTMPVIRLSLINNEYLTWRA